MAQLDACPTGDQELSCAKIDNEIFSMFILFR